MTLKYVNSLRSFIPEEANYFTPHHTRTEVYDFFEEGQRQVIKILRTSGADQFHKQPQETGVIHVCLIEDDEFLTPETAETLFLKAAETQQLIRSYFGDIVLDGQYLTDGREFGVVAEFIESHIDFSSLLSDCFVWSHNQTEAGLVDINGVNQFIEYVSDPERIHQFLQFVSSLENLMRDEKVCLDLIGDNLTFSRDKELFFIDSFEQVRPIAENDTVELEVVKIIAEAAYNNGQLSENQLRDLQSFKRFQPSIGRLLSYQRPGIASLINKIQQVRAQRKLVQRRKLSEKNQGKF